MATVGVKGLTADGHSIRRWQTRWICEHVVKPQTSSSDE